MIPLPSGLSDDQFRYFILFPELQVSTIQKQKVLLEVKEAICKDAAKLTFDLNFFL